ncbi:MAG: hypothetical protein N3D10_02040 [Candidatus Micrarchaeota archaeon]|nr:hypothetical protein [Candidatus Micrarchaeota archaeon]
MPKVQADSLYGIVKESFPIFEDNFDQVGTIYACQNGIVVKYKDQLIRAPYEYVRKMEKVSNLALGKVSVIFQIYDESGMEHNMAVAINDIHYTVLKKLFPNLAD